MDRRSIASLDVSVLGVGCNNFGMRLDAAETATVIDGALDLGVNYFDTADMYGGTKSEEYIGRALKGRRQEAVIATKFGMPLDDNRKGAHPDYVKQACDASLQRLQTDYIDLYILHTPDPTVPLADTMGALSDLVVAGKVREIGCSNFSSELLRQADAASHSDGGPRFVNVQNEYSLLKRDDEQDVLPVCAELGLTYSPYFPLASGLLTGKYRKGEAFPEGSRLDSIEYFRYNFSDDNMDKVEALIDYAAAHNHSVLDLALSWLVAQPNIPSVIAGATSVEQIKANKDAIAWELSPAQLNDIDALT